MVKQKNFNIAAMTGFFFQVNSQVIIWPWSQVPDLSYLAMVLCLLEQLIHHTKVITHVRQAMVLALGSARLFSLELMVSLY